MPFTACATRARSEAAVVTQQAGDQGWQGEEVKDVVAKIGEQGRLSWSRYPDQVAQRVGEALDDRQRSA
jgi:hypothetical protein